MANHDSAKKRIRQNAVRVARNRSRKSVIRTLTSKFDAAIASGDKELAKTAFLDLQSKLHKAVNKNIIHKNTVARRVSSLSAQLKSIS